MNMKDVKKIVIPESAPQETEVVVANTSKAFSSSSTQSSFTYLNYYQTSDSNLGSNSKLRIKGTITSVSGTEYDEGGLYYRNSSGNLTSIGFSAGQTKSFDVVCYLTSEVSSTVWEVFTVEQYNMYGTKGNQMRVQLNKTNNNNLDIYVYNTFAQALFTLTITEVSEYQTVENPVVKITDSNGNIIWGSQSAFPYRRLEYIKFSGAEYVDTNTALPTGNTYKRFDLILDFQNSSNWGVNGFDSRTNNRFNMGVNGNGYARYGSGSTNTWQDSDGYKFSLNAKYGLVLWANKGSTNMTIQQNGSDIWKSATRSISFTSATGNLYIGAVNNNGSIANYCEEKLYSARLASGSYTGRLFLGIPCQRKSDGVCGLYDTQNNVFRPMIGTSITDAAAGPVVDEYWNLQA